MGKFDSVITDLKWLVSLGQRARTSDVAELYQAIRVLEAAAKVDKQRALHLEHDSDDIETLDAIDGLLNALPAMRDGEAPDDTDAKEKS